MKKTAAILLSLTIALMSFSSHANNPNPKPKCPLGQIPVLDGNLWQCKQPGYKSNEKSQKVGLLLPAVQAAREAARQEPRRSQSAAPKPRCLMGQVAKMEMGHWQCKNQGLTTGQNAPRASTATHRPHCRVGLLPRMENGQWVCRQPDLKAPTKSER